MNPYQTQRRMVKAVTLADMAQRLGLSPEAFESEWPDRYEWARDSGTRPASRETWDLAVDLLRSRAEYEGPGGLDDPSVVQRLARMAVDIAETLSRNDVDSDEAEVLPKTQKRLVAKLSKADTSATTFDLGKVFLRMREEFRLKR
ncbi:MAG: hypothetical protein CL489_17820 [Acidobacteria bacterium]|nr:hypothetical protein [Acidobacteriota bacterium]